MSDLVRTQIVGFLMHRLIFFFQILVVVADITKEQDMMDLVDQAIHKFGRIDVLVISVHTS